MLLNDLRYTARLLRKSPLFTLAIVLTVALGIGANTAIFSFVNAVMLRPLPYHEPDRLVWIAERNDTLNLPRFAASVLNYLSWKEQQRTFAQIGATGFTSFNLTGQGEPEQFTGRTLTPSLFPLLGITPVLGRSFSDGDDRPGSEKVAIISEALWKRRFGSDPSIIGRALTLNGVDTTVVGIAPASLAQLTNGDIWAPLTIDPAKEIRLNHVILAVGRLRPGVTLERAQAEMDVVATHVGQQYPEVKDWGIRLVDFYHVFVSPQLQTALVVLLAAVGCVLLIASANVANMLLARAGARQKEIAVRTAMGAGRARLLKQLLIESLVLSALGGSIGVVGAWWGVNAINALIPANLLPVPDVSIDVTVLLFAVALTIVTGLLFGLAPAWHAAKTDLNEVLKQTTRASAGTRSRLRNALAAAELALATILLIGAGLLVQSLLRLQHVDLGFQPDRLLTFQLALPPSTYPPETTAEFYRRLLESLRATPGVGAAAVSSGIPFGGGNYTATPIVTRGPSPMPPDTAVTTDWRIVSPGYFGAMGIPLVRGREFLDSDCSIAAPRVVIVSQATARRFWGESDPLGRTLHRQGDPAREYTVIGVVGDVRQRSLNLESPAIYYPSFNLASRMDVVVRTEALPTSILPAVRQKVHELDAALPISTVQTMEEWLASSAAQPRLNAILLGVFAGVAMLIAAIGIYGVLAYSVNQRTQEIGLRMALGAPSGHVLRLIVREGMTVGAIGIGVGVAGALVANRVLESLVFEIPVRDPLTYLAVAGSLAAVALFACVIPALRASRVDPIVALRYD
ncbi:MAG TPA: ABC transporter permease [Vicinamibacterales bacterium]|nr:ABC transporter permease [Vicinamibacterales bacterium]